MSQDLSSEYVCLFNAVSDAIKELESIRLSLILAQQQAEEIYIERVE